MSRDERAAYVDEVTGLLGPDRARTVDYRVVPSRERPRLLVPRSGRAAASAIRFSVEAVGRKARVRRAALSTAFRLGLGGVACRDTVAVGEGLDLHLAEVLGQPVLFSVHIGPPRANRKPVLTLLDERGGLVGFAKLGVNELTRALVDAEAEALTRLSTVDTAPIVVPGVRHHGRWGEHALLVQEALPVWLPRARGASPDAGMRALVGAFGVREHPLRDSTFGVRLRKSVHALDDAPRLVSIVDTLAERIDVLPFGCWHGDWNGGNSAALADGRLLVWDWERFDDDVPAGFDALHLALQGAITRGGVAPAEAAWDLLATAGARLVPFGVPAAGAPLVAMLYLVELAARYLRDRQAEAGARLGRVDEWLVPAIERNLRQE